MQNNSNSTKIGASIVWYTSMSLFSWLMLGLSLPYLSGERNVDFLITKQQIVQSNAYYYPFMIHVCTSIFVLVAGAFQFSHYLQHKQARVHRALGYVYVLGVLGVAGPGGLVIAWYANGGIGAQISFVALSILWILLTYLAFRAVLQKKMRQHRALMIYSYSLTLSAITLRIYQWAAEVFFDPDPITSYQIAAWLSWTFNLIVAAILVNSRVV